ncbi:hypothetical protein Tco_1019986 [Tanacetum coccineum]|uniref:Secreted protein n=1 Tax=Tanacetum coccineum TaxID=301880 RepID=A0ABQ5FYR8_9ASTR
MLVVTISLWYFHLKFRNSACALISALGRLVSHLLFHRAAVILKQFPFSQSIESIRQSSIPLKFRGLARLSSRACSRQRTVTPGRHCVKWRLGDRGGASSVYSVNK